MLTAKGLPVELVGSSRLPSDRTWTRSWRRLVSAETLKGVTNITSVTTVKITPETGALLVRCRRVKPSDVQNNIVAKSHLRDHVS
jgi:hypothetical protein